MWHVRTGRGGGTLQKQRCSKAASQPDTQRLDVIERGRELVSLVSQNRMAELECPETLPGCPVFIQGRAEVARVRMLLPTGRETDSQEG